MATDDTVLRMILAVLAVIVLVPVLVMAFMMPMMGLWGWGHMGDGVMFDGTLGLFAWLLIWIGLLVFVLGIGYGFYRLVGGAPGRASDPALEELRMAYARGDLSAEEFESRRNRLEREE